MTRTQLPKILGRSLGLCLGLAMASHAGAAAPQPPKLPPVPGSTAATAPIPATPAPAQPQAVASNSPFLVPPPPPVQRPTVQLGTESTDFSHSAPATLGAVSATPGSPVAKATTNAVPMNSEDAWAPTSSKAPPSTVVIEEAAAPLTLAEVAPAEDPPPAAVPQHRIEPMVAGPTAAAPQATSPADHRQAVLHKRATRPDDGKLPHRGFVVEAKVGTMGCFKAVCSGHKAAPGLRLDGFIGGNAGGIFEFGLQGGWGNLRSGGAGQNALALYGIDPVQLQDYLTAQMGTDELGIDLTQLTVRNAKASAAQFGPAVRIHFIPRGRMMGYVGTGLGYSLFRGEYETNTGHTRLDFHGLSIPMQGGLGVFLTKNLAVDARFDYVWSRYFMAVLDHPDQHSPIPVGRIDSAIGRQLNPDLPKFWTVTFGLRGRF